MFGGVNIVQVEPGTVIEHLGEKLTVEDNGPVVKGNTIYVTEKAFEAFRAKSVKAQAGIKPGPFGI